MIFGIQKNVKWCQVALWPVAVPVMCVLVLPFAVVACVGLARDWLRDRAVTKPSVNAQLADLEKGARARRGEL